MADVNLMPALVARLGALEMEIVRLTAERDQALAELAESRLTHGETVDVATAGLPATILANGTGAHGVGRHQPAANLVGAEAAAADRAGPPPGAM